MKNKNRVRRNVNPAVTNSQAQKQPNQGQEGQGTAPIPAAPAIHKDPVETYSRRCTRHDLEFFTRKLFNIVTSDAYAAPLCLAAIEQHLAARPPLFGRNSVGQENPEPEVEPDHAATIRFFDQGVIYYYVEFPRAFYHTVQVAARLDGKTFGDLIVSAIEDKLEVIRAAANAKEPAPSSQPSSHQLAKGGAR